MEKNGLNGKVYDFSFSYETIHASDKKELTIFDKKHNVLQISGLNQKMFIVFELVLLCFDGSLAIKFVFMNNQPCLVTSMLIDLNPDKLYYHPFIISMNSW